MIQHLSTLLNYPIQKHENQLPPPQNTTSIQPALTSASMIATWNSQTLLAQILQLRKFLSYYPAGSTFESLCNKTYGIFQWILDQEENMIRTNRHINYLNIQFLTNHPDNCLDQHRHFAPVLRRKYHMVGKQ